VLGFSLKKLRLINYLLAVFVLAAMLLLIRDVISAPFAKKGQPPVKRAESPSQTTFTRKNLIEYSSVLEKNPFGRPGKLYPITGAQSDDKEVVDISLSNLILMGTAVGSEKLSYAIFEDRARPQGGQEIFAPGDNVFNYGVLKKIGRSDVEIERNSMTYTVSIPDITIESGKDRTQLGGTPQSGTSFARKIGEREYLLDGQRIQKSLENPEQILTDARLLPNLTNGKQEGFAISEVVPGGIYHSLGLKNGDILLRINGLEISNPEVAIQAMSALKGMNNVDLDIIRNKQNMSMNYRIK